MYFCYIFAHAIIPVNVHVCETWPHQFIGKKFASQKLPFHKSTESILNILPYNRAPSTGKLINFIVDDGGHVFAGDVFAEIEIMKMVMELRVNERGW
jgi:biotin carboxyl carrier protein